LRGRYIVFGISLGLDKVGTTIHPMLRQEKSSIHQLPRLPHVPARVLWIIHVQKRSRVAEGGEELYWPRQLELASYVQPYANFVSRAAQALIGISHWMAAGDSALGI
jgi:hypothetical protein